MITTSINPNGSYVQLNDGTGSQKFWLKAYIRDCKRVIHWLGALKHNSQTSSYVESGCLKISVCRIGIKLLDLYTSVKEKFCRRLVTGDETRVHHWGPESKLDPVEASTHPKKFRTRPSANKVIATIFWDSGGLLCYLPSKKTIIGQYCAELTFKLHDAIKQKRHGKLSLGAWLLHDNAPVHRSLVVQQAVRGCGFVQLNHLIYSLDPSDYYLFRNNLSGLEGLTSPHWLITTPTGDCKVWSGGRIWPPPSERSKIQIRR